MNVLVTGGAGFIGSSVVRQLVAKGARVSVIDRNPCAVQGVNSIVADCASDDARAFIMRERPDFAIHLAASIDARSADPEEMIKENVEKAAAVLDACERVGVKKFVFASSCAVYGEPARLPVAEGAPLISEGAYGISKKQFEVKLLSARTESVSLRLANVYGPGQPAGVVSIFARAMLAGQPPTINGSGEITRDFVFVEDAARAFLLALEKGEGAYNIGSGKETSLNELVELLGQQCDFSGEAVHADAKEEVQRMMLDCSRAKRDLYWEPEYSLVKGLALVAAFERERRAQVGV